ncbi:hypothetical protein BG004_001302 [Podila humilis]|nr:hypothetical protein BG004_001302 [Podila humilis]
MMNETVDELDHKKIKKRAAKIPFDIPVEAVSSCAGFIYLTPVAHLECSCLLFQVLARPVYFGRKLEDLSPPTKFPVPQLDDGAVMKVIRVWNAMLDQIHLERLNGDRDARCETIRMETIIMKTDKTVSESTFVTNYESPLLHGTLTMDDERVQNIPNTESQIQKQQGIKADRPNFIL